MGMTSGFINVLKPTGLTSSDVVVRVRKILSELYGCKVKTGHMGTLDPAGAGVLPIAFGKATRLFDYMLAKEKTYRAGFVFGAETDTLDSCGAITATGHIPHAGEVKKSAAAMTGEIYQIPPMYSAVSVKGVRCYKLARSGVWADITPRRVEIKRISISEGRERGAFDCEIRCSSGTYIRSVVRDIAYSLGTVGYMSYIIRTESGVFDIDDSVTLDALARSPEKYMLPVEYVLGDAPVYDIGGGEAERLLNGIGIAPPDVEGDIAVRSSEGLLGLGRVEDGKLKLKVRLI